MKHNTPEKMKFKKLQRKLKASRRDIVGLLDLLWITTSTNAIEGDIGRYDNESIAIECDWEGDPDDLVAALVECGWLDEHEEGRLVVHDWPDHCPNWVKGNVIKHHDCFRFYVTPDDGNDAGNDTTEHDEEPPKGGSPKQPPLGGSPGAATIKSSQVKSNLTKSNPLAAARDAAAIFDLRRLEGTGKVRDASERLGRVLAKRKITGIDRDWIWWHSAVGELIKPGFIADTSSKILENQVGKPKSYIEKSLREECQAVGADLAAAIAHLRAQAPTKDPPPRDSPTLDRESEPSPEEVATS